jgi:tetratricopeptide (TPR) repeat protein
MSGKAEQNTSSIITSIQKFLLYFFITILPVSILPFPWDLTEKSMAIVLLAFTLIILGLEVVKIIWSGKILFLKRDIDLILFLLLISFILSTVFAQDSNLSIFGYNYRLSAGLIGISAVILLAFITRSFILKKQELLHLFHAFLVGSILTSFFSIISLFGANIFNIIPKIGIMGLEGSPTLGSPIILAIYNCIAILLGYISLSLYRSDKDVIDASWFSIVGIIVNSFTLVLFSAQSRVFVIAIIFLLMWILFLAITYFKDKKLDIKTKINQSILPLILLLTLLLMRFDAIRNLILGNKEILSSLNLSLDFSWQIVSQSLMRSLKNGILGMGLDSFGVIFTALKPADLLNVNLTSSFNEVLTSLSNGGFLWFVIWIILGWYILKDLILDIKNYDRKFKAIILFDILQLFVYLTSFITTYTLILRFTFFLLISMGVVLRNIYKQTEVDNLLLKMWTMGTGKEDEKSFPVISIFLTIICTILVILGIIKLGGVTLSSVYLIRAESYITQQNIKFEDQELTLEQRETITNNLYRWYDKALQYDSKNPLTNRKASIVAVDKLGVLLEKYKNSEDEEILNEAVNLRGEAFEYSRTAINLSPSLYESYNNRARVYLGVINLGYSEYVRDAISVLDEAIEMKPLDYQNYYNKAQLYYLLQNYDLALKSSTQALTIKGDYIPALILSANINGAQNKTEVQQSYLQATKTILEDRELQDTQLYKDILEQINSTEEETTPSVDENEDVPETEQ